MSILKSTNSGIQKIPLTIEYLLENKWYIKDNGRYKESSFFLGNSCLKIYKDNEHKLYLWNHSKRYEKDNIMFVYYDFDKDKCLQFSFIVSTISDLYDLEEYWKNSCIDYEFALKNLALNERAKEAVEKYLNTRNLMEHMKEQLTSIIRTTNIKSMKNAQNID